MLPDPTEIERLRLIKDILETPSLSVKLTREQEEALFQILVNSLLFKYTKE